jgi:hypothetical protein
VASLPALALALAATLADDGDGALWARASLALRTTAQGGVPSAEVLFDPAAQVFDAARWLAPGPTEAWLSGIAGVSAGLDAAEWLSFRLDADTGLLRAQRPPAPATVCFSSQTPSGLAIVAPGACTGAGQGILRLGLPSTVEAPAELTSNGVPFADAVAETWLVRQLYADAVAGRAGFLHARVGRQRLRVADGLVYDDWGLGVDLDADVGAIGPPIAASVSAFYPTRGWPSEGQWANPVLAATLEWTPSLGEWVGLWGAFSHDDAGDAAAILRQGIIASDVVRLIESAPGSATYVAASRRIAALLAAPVRGTSTLGWAGASGRLEVGRTGEIRFAAGASFGTVGTWVTRLGEGTSAVDVPALGWMGSARWRSQVGPLSLSPFFVWLSGASPATPEQVAGDVPLRYTGFLSISPFLAYTNLFFSGGISEAYADRRAVASGVYARGVLAPGIEAGWTPAREIEVTLKAAFLASDRSGPFGGRIYGPEVDLDVAWSPWPWLAVLGEADALALGSFFPTQELAWRVILGVNVATP